MHARSRQRDAADARRRRAAGLLQGVLRGNRRRLRQLRQQPPPDGDRFVGGGGDGGGGGHDGVGANRPLSQWAAEIWRSTQGAATGIGAFGSGARGLPRQPVRGF